MTRAEIDAVATRLQVGDRIYYTGDMANHAAHGTIVARNEDPRWGLSYDIEFDADEDDVARATSLGIRPASFTAGPGQRFKTARQLEDERAEAIARLRASLGR